MSRFKRVFLGLAAAALIGFSAVILSSCAPAEQVQPAVAAPDPGVSYVRSPDFATAQADAQAGRPISEAFLMEHIHATWAKHLVTTLDDAFYQCGISQVSDP